MKTSSRKTSSLLVSGLLFGAIAGCGGGVDRTVVVHEQAPAPSPVVEAEPVEEEPVVMDGPEEPGGGGLPEGTVVEVQIEREYVARGGHRMRGIAIAHFNTGYLDGWAGADFFNHGQPLSDSQVERMIDVGRRQGDPTGKLALVGYQEGYRAGAKHEPNPYARRMSPEQAARLRTMRGLPPETTVVEVAPPPGTRLEVKRESNVHVHNGESEAARKARVEASKNNLQASRNNLEAEQKKLEAERKKVEVARLEREAARKAELEEAKNKREAEHLQRETERKQREVALKAKIEADKKQRETERQQRELALKLKIEAEKKQREENRKRQELARQQKDADRDAEDEAEKKDRESEKDERHAARDKREAERKQRLAEKKAEREAKKSQTADTSEQGH